MFIAIVTIFAICWAPYHMFYVYAYHKPHITSTNITPHLFLAFYWLAMSNSMVNPIIYYWMNRRFRHHFQRILCFCCFRFWKIDNTLAQQNSMSLERKPRLRKFYLHISLIGFPADSWLNKWNLFAHWIINTNDNTIWRHAGCWSTDQLRNEQIKDTGNMY